MSNEKRIPDAEGPMRAVLDPRWLAGRGRLAQSIRLEERGPGRFAIVAILMLAISLIGFLAWAATTRVGEITAASGEVVPLGSVQQIQHLEGGIVSKIMVHDGDIVNKDQALMELSDSQAAPDLAQIRTRQSTLEMARSRLEALSTMQPEDIKPDDARFGSLDEGQSRLLRERLASYENQKSVLQRQLDQRKAEVDTLKSQMAPMQQQVDILAKQIDMRSGLVEKGYASRLTLMDQERALAQARTAVADLHGRIATGTQAIAEAEARLAGLDDALQLEASEELARVRAEAAELQQTLDKAGNRVDRLVIRSPVHGIVKGMTTRTIGSVVGAGATVMEIIPIDDTLVVDARVLTKDIGFVHIGQTADVKVTTYDYTRFGAIDGTVETISATTFQDDRGTPFYRVRVRLAKDHVGNDPKRNPILPGMTVLADINTGSKTVLAYLLRPLTQTTGSAFHER